MVSKHRLKGASATYCPINIEEREITFGLSLVGFYPKGAQVVGTFNKDIEKLIIFKKYQKLTENGKQ